MSFLADSLEQLNQNSLVDPATLESARQRWNARTQEMHLQKPLDSLFVIIYAQIQTQIDTFMKAIFSKISTATHESELEVPIWSFHAGGTTPDDKSHQWFVATHDELGANVHSPVPILNVLQRTDICLRLSAIFGSDFSVFYRPVLAHDTKYELILRYLPEGRKEKDKLELAKVWSKYGRLGIVDKLHHLPQTEVYVLHRGPTLGDLTVRAPPSSPSKRRRSISSEESLRSDASNEETKRPHYGCYCQYSF